MRGPRQPDGSYWFHECHEFGIVPGSANADSRTTDEVMKHVVRRSDDLIAVELISYGAAIRGIRLKDRYHQKVDIVLGLPSVEDYKSPTNPYMGAIVGRVANRIKDAEFVCHDQIFRVTKNLNDRHHIHGGKVGFSHRNWGLLSNRNDVNKTKFLHVSKDLEEGYQGKLSTTVTYKVTEERELKVRMEAEVADQPTVVNLTNHAYFNLAGHNAGPQALYNHKIQVFADRVLATDEDLMPTGELIDVETNTQYDLRESRNLGERIRNLGNGFDHHYCLNGTSETTETLVARLEYPPNGLYMEVYTNQPGIQIYTANNFPKEGDEEQLIGKSGVKYVKHAGICFETQKWPDAPHHPSFPSINLRPSATYVHEVTYKFGLLPDSYYETEGEDKLEAPASDDTDDTPRKKQRLHSDKTD